MADEEIDAGDDRIGTHIGERFVGYVRAARIRATFPKISATPSSL